MARYHVPGAVIAFVENGKVVYLKGYGYANVARRQRVTAARTVFRVASLSKLITATAVMQLAAADRVHLGDDVNQYLTGFGLARTYPRPVTLATLLTHTSGLGDRSIAIASSRPSDLLPLGVFLRERLPPRAMPPGTFYSYTNWNYDLAGYIVQTVSRQPFARYVNRHIFSPLDMNHSTFVQPPAPRLGHPATGYLMNTSPPQVAPMWYMNGIPSAGLSTTAADMAHFLLAQLDGGVFHRGRILAPAMVNVMQHLHFRTAPGADFRGMGYGFERWNDDGTVVLSKDGNIPGFGSHISLFPAKHLGFFIAANTEDSDWMHDFETRFVQRYYPRHVLAPVTPPALRGSLGAFTGTYWSNTYARDTIEKLNQLTQQVDVQQSGPGTLTMSFSNGGSVRLTRVRPLLFEFVYRGVPHDWAFVRDSSGRVAYLYASNQEFDRISWYQVAAVQEALFGLFLLVFLVGAITGPIGYAVSRHRQRRQESGGAEMARLPVLARSIATLTCALNAVFLIGLAVAFERAEATQDQGYSWINLGIPFPIYVLLALPLVTTAFAVALPLVGIAAWRATSWTRLSRLSYGLATLSAFAFIPFLLSWNLLGFHV
jgi:CubicO group peptidase (beta-lactamase class C family)